MRVKAQVAMVMNLDKCIGCHTCSVTCKQVWTNRPGTEYVWFNNVETAPGQGYPRRWADQVRWRGGWELDRRGRLRLRAGGRLKKLLTIFSNPDLPAIDDYYEPFTYDYETLVTAPLSDLDPVARPHSQLTGEPMEVTWGPNWDEGLAGSEESAPQDPHLQGMRGAGPDDLRAGVHVLPAADLRALPEPVVRGQLPVGRDVQARGGRHRARRPGPLPRLALLRLGLPVQEGLLQPPHRQGREVHALLPADRGRPAHDLLGDVRRPHPLPRPGPVRRRPHRGGRLGARRARPARRAARRVPRPGGRRRRRPPRGATASRTTGSRRRAARRSTTWRCAGAWRCRCTPSSGRCRWSGTCRRSRRWSRRWRPTATRRIPTTSSARSRTCGSRSSTSPTCSPRGTSSEVRAVLQRLAAMRAYMRKREVLGETDESMPERVGLTGPELERMYRLLAIADYEDRYVIPQAHAELGERLMQEQGGCGLDFEGGPGNCGAVDPRPGHVLAHVVDGESFHLIDILQRASARRMRRRAPRWSAALGAALVRAALPGRPVVAARDGRRRGRRAAAGPRARRRSSASSRAGPAIDGARRALRGDVRPAPAGEPPHDLLRARRHARARHGAAAAQEALPRRRPAARQPASCPTTCTVMLAFAALAPDGYGEALLAEHRPAIELLRLSLHDLGSAYAHVLDAVAALLPRAHRRASAPRSRAWRARGHRTRRSGSSPTGRRRRCRPGRDA